MPAQTIARAKSVLAKLEQYELAVFAENKQNSIALETAVGRASKSKMASQFSLFAITNENIIDELRTAEIEKMTERQTKGIFGRITKTYYLIRLFSLSSFTLAVGNSTLYKLL